MIKKTTNSFKNNVFDRKSVRKRKRKFKGRDYKYIYYNREKFIRKFSFLSRMKMIWDKVYYTSFVNRLVRKDFKNTRRPFYYITDDIHNSLTISDFLVFDKYWSRFTKLSQEKLPLWNFSGFDKGMLGLKCAWDQRTTDGLYFSTKLEQARRTWFISRLGFRVASILAYVVKVNLFWYLFLFLSLFILSWSYFSLYFTAGFELHGFFTWFESYVRDSSHINTFPQHTLSYFVYLYSIQWISDFSYLFLGEGFWTIKSSYYNYLDSWFYLNLNLQHVWFMGASSFFDERLVGVLHQLDSIDKSAIFRFYESFVIRLIDFFIMPYWFYAVTDTINDFYIVFKHELLYDFMPHYILIDYRPYIVEYTWFYINQYVWFITIHYDDYLRQWLFVLLNDLETLRDNIPYLIKSWPSIKKKWFTSKVYLYYLKEVLSFFWDNGSSFFFVLTSFFYKFLFLDKAVSFVLYLSKTLYIYQLAELLAKPLKLCFDIFYDLLLNIWIEGFSKGIFFNYMYKDVIHDFFFFIMEFTNTAFLRDFLFMRRYTVSYLYNWYVFLPMVSDTLHQIWSVWIYHVPTYAYWVSLNFIIYSVQFLASLVFEDYFTKPIQSDLEWLYEQMSFFFVFEREEGVLRSWFLDFKGYFKEHNDSLFGGALFPNLFWDQNETLFFLNENRDFNLYWYDYIIDYDPFINRYLYAPIQYDKQVIFPIDNHRNFVWSLNELTGQLFLILIYSLNLLANSTTVSDFSFLGLFRSFLYSWIGHGFENESIQLMYRNWLHWKSNVYRYSDDRMRSIYKEAQLYLVDKHLFSLFFKPFFSNNNDLFEKHLLQQNLYININDLYLEAAWELWNSFKFSSWNFSIKDLNSKVFFSNIHALQTDQNRLSIPEFFDFRNLLEGSPFHFFSILGLFHEYNVLREFGFYRPDGILSGASLVDAFYDGIMEAEYDRFSKPHLYSFYHFLGWLHTFWLFTFDFVRMYELSMGYVIASGNFIWTVGGFETKMIFEDDINLEEFPYFKDYEGWHRLKDEFDFDFYHNEVIKNYDTISLFPRPYSRMATDWMLINDLYKSRLLLDNESSFSYVTVPALNSFDEYWRFMSYYDGSSKILYWELRDSFFAAPLIYNLFTVWRDFFILGVPISIITSEFMPFFPYNLPWFLTFFEYFLNFLIFVFYSMQICIQFFFSIMSGNVESLIVLYMIFFSENAVISKANLNSHFFFNFFLWFYDISLFASNNMMFWVMVKLDTFSNNLYTTSSFYDQFKKSFDFFVGYSQYKRYTVSLRLISTAYFKQLSPFFTVYDSYIDFHYSKLHENKIKEKWVALNENHNFRGFRKTASIMHMYIPFFPDLYNISDGLIQNEIINLLNYVSGWVSYYKTGVLEWIDWYSDKVYNNTYYKEKFSTAMPFFNIIAEIHFSQKGMFFDKNTFPLLLQTHVLDHPVFLEYYKLGRYAKMQEGGVLFLQETFAQEWYVGTAFNAYFSGQGNFYGGMNFRVQRIFGFWYIFDFFFAFACILFVSLSIACTRAFWVMLFPIFDPWWGYVYMRYPRLGFQNMHEKRDDIALRAIEDSADLTFDAAYFYHQSADHIYLPYRRFAFESWNQKPAWYFLENNTLDMSLESFFDLGKPYKEKQRKRNYYKQLNEEWDVLKETTKRLIKNKPNFYFKQELRFFPMLDYWFLDKNRMKQEYRSQIPFYVVTVFVIMIVSIYSSCFEFFRKSWLFNWLFAKPDIFFEYCWTTLLIKIWPTFFEYLSGFMAISSFFLFWVVVIYIYRLLLTWMENFFSFTYGFFNFFSILFICLIFGILSSTRYWTARLLSSRFLHKLSGYYFIDYKWRLSLREGLATLNQGSYELDFGVDLTSLIEMNKGPYSEIIEIYKRNTTMGLAPLYNKDILKADLVNDSFFLTDLHQIVFENSLDFVDVQSNQNLVSILAKQGSLISSSKFLPMLDSEIQDTFYKHSLINNSYGERSFLFERTYHYGFDLQASISILSSYQIDENNLYFRVFQTNDLFSHWYRSNNFVLFDIQLQFNQWDLTNMETGNNGLRGLPHHWNFSGGLYQAGWSGKRFLQDLFINWEDFPVQQDHSSFLFRKDIQKFLNYQRKNKPRLVTFEKMPWIVELFQNPFSNAPWVKTPSSLSWPVGGVKPTMPESITHEWRDPDIFLGLCDDFLAYRELFDRSTEMIGAEQSWGFVDIMDKVGRENQEFFFRQEFYKRLYDEKLERLAVKEIWSDFDISISEPADPGAITDEILDKGFKDATDPILYRHFFLGLEDARANIMPYDSYSKLSKLKATKDLRIFDAYDDDYIFNLDFGFDYYNLE